MRRAAEAAAVTRHLARQAKQDTGDIRMNIRELRDIRRTSN